MSQTGHVTALATWDADRQRLVLDSVPHYPSQELAFPFVKKLNPGAGERFVVRVEREEDAYTYAQLKYYWGQVITPLSEWNGDFKEDWHLRLKSDYMPEGKTSLTRLNHEELRDYILRCEVYAHTAHPEAFVLYDQPLRATA